MLKSTVCGEYMEAVDKDEHETSFIQFSAFVGNVSIFYPGSLRPRSQDDGMISYRYEPILTIPVSFYAV